ncbi:MAG: MBL fold metallo-hydrolase [Candidatus Marsarchaeota archaeon]|nr:MBL fold metallo-hydrolase [Candidatus Marsarchaeota archaeon]
MKITFFGAAGEVGRSCIMISTENTNILLDAGLKVLEESMDFPLINNEQIANLDGVFLTHAHVDHCSFVPHLFARGYQGKIYATKPTLELLNIQIADYMRLSKPKEITKEILTKMQKNYQIIEYRRTFRLRDLNIQFFNAGHIIGSAAIKVNDKKSSILYTGDIHLTKTKLLDGADLQNINADTLITESTYGGANDIFPSEKELASKMTKSIKDTLLSGGKVIIPSFGVGRGQEVLLFLDDFMNSGVLPKVPIYVDGMISKVLRIHRHNVIYCKKEIQSKILMSDYDPFKSNNFIIVDKKSLRKKIIEEKQCSIIVTTSGMLTGGPVVGYLKNLAKDNINKLILVGFQPEGSAGRDLQDGAKEIDFHGSHLQINLSVEVHHMSAHADRKQLEQIPQKLQGLKSIFLIHGEPNKIESLYNTFKNKYTTIIPKILDNYDI